MLYFPNNIKYVDETKLDFPPTEYVFGKLDDVELHAWHFKANEKNRRKVTIILFHGNGQNMSAHFRGMYWIIEHGYDLVIFDYPGYGPNLGEPTPDSTVESGKMALNWAKENLKGHKFVILGQSLGGNVALRSLSEKPKFPHCQVIIESSFLSYKEVAQNVMNNGWLSWPFQFMPYLILSDDRAITHNIDGLPKSNYLVIHGEKDHQVPVHLGIKLFEELPKEKEFWNVKGGKHIDTFFRHKKYRPRLLSLLEKNCG